MATFTGVLERTTRRYRGQLTDETGETPIALAQLTAVTLTLFSVHTQAIINGRDAQNVLNANGVTISSSGELVWTLTPEDTAILDDSLDEEHHRAIFTWTWDGGAKIGRWEVNFIVQNLATVGVP